MTPDNSTRRSGIHANGPGNGPGLDPRAVLIADGDPEVTDEIARALRDRYAIRTAYSGGEALASLDEAVRVALFDPDLADLSTDRLAERTLDCQFAALVGAGASDVGAPFDDSLRKPVSETALRETVAALCRRATYRRTLEQYYELASTAAETDRTDPDRERIERRLEELRSELDVVLDSLDRTVAFEAALGDSGE